MEQIRGYGAIVVRFDNGRRLGFSDTFLAAAPRTAPTDGGVDDDRR